MSSPKATTTKRAAVAQVTPAFDTGLNKSLQVDKNVVDELLLVCGVIGTAVQTDSDGQERIVPVTDCLNWLQDLQRALRRDEDLYRPISLLLGHWKVVQQKLLPLVLSCSYDTTIVLTVCKILVILTKPLAENTVRAGRMVIDPKPKSKKKFTPSEESDLTEEQQQKKKEMDRMEQEFYQRDKALQQAKVQEQIKLRENALQQAEQLMEYKRAICHHPSHTGPNGKQQGGILSIFVSLLGEPLSKTGTARSDADHLTIELVLHLIRNLLSAEPLLHPSADAAARAQQLHHEFVSLLEREDVLKVLLVLAADLEQRENVQYNLLLMELLNHLLRHQDPTAVARSNMRTAGKENTTGQLKQQLQRERQSYAATASSRHSHFGGTLVKKNRPGGKQQYMSTAVLTNPKKSHVSVPKRKNKKSDPFIGSGRSLLQHSRMEDASGPAKLRAQRVLDKFCRRFVLECYGPVMKSLKNEFRRDSVRLEDGDRVVFFRIAWFFCQWWRMSGKKISDTDNKASSAVGQLIFTMDVFTFNLVLNATDTFQEHKKYARLAQTIALLSEMMHLLHIMYTSKESTEQIMAMGLMDRLFYGNEPLDRLPKLLSKWEPGTSTREHLCDLVEVCHMQLKLLDANTKASADFVGGKKDIKHDTVAKMKATASEFDVKAYFARKIVSNHTVLMYTQLLSQYAVNAPHVNHRIIAFFLRASKLKIATAEPATDPEMPQNLLAAKTVTLEPMLYNINLLMVLNTILNDAGIRKDKDYATTLSFAAGLVHNFAKAAEQNPMLFVEALLKHPVPHRFCNLVTNMYVNEELRMIAERELLLEEQQRLEEEVAAVRNNDQDESDDEEEELEFEDFGVTVPSKPSSKKDTKANATKKRKAVEDSDEEEEADNDKASQSGSKRSSDEDDDESEDEMEKKLKKLEQKAAKRSTDLYNRIHKKKAQNDESSDEEELNFGKIDSGPVAKKVRTIEDDSDDE